MYNNVLNNINIDNKEIKILLLYINKMKINHLFD